VAQLHVTVPAAVKRMTGLGLVLVLVLVLVLAVRVLLGVYCVVVIGPPGAL
jgi:hypothetical protein